jgi:eukaryotic-like serine/threonine-protein kinase
MANMSPRPNSNYLQPGTQLNGMYEVDEPIAAGGMGEVYRGHSIQTHDPVAIKVIKADFAEHETAMALFRKEASALHNLQNEAIVRYYAFAVDPVLQRAYLAMEYVEGDSLSDIAKRGPLPVEAVRLLARRIALGLHTAHERGIIHRDVSPDNIILPQNDVRQAKIIDFGIARSTRKTDGTVIGGGFAGKHNYVSPEQLGLFGGEVTGKSDIYSLGLVLVEALRGTPLDMGGSQVDVIDKRRSVPNLAFIDPRIRPLIEAMLQPDPADRPASMLAVADWTEPPQASAPKRGASVPPEALARAHAAAAKAGGAAPAPERTSRAGLIGVIAVLLLAVGGAGGYMLLGKGGFGPAPSPVPPVPVPVPVPVPTPVPTTRPKRPVTLTPIIPLVDKMRNYVRDSGMGECFASVPVKLAENAATVQSFALETAPFKTLNDGFRNTFGFEPEIEGWQLTRGQCPFAVFMGKAKLDPAMNVKIEIVAPNLRSGQYLTGAVESAQDKTVEVLYLADDGIVQSITEVVRTTGAKPFNMKVERSGPRGAKLQLIVAIVSPTPLTTLAALRDGHPVTADKLFPALAAEIATKGQAVGVSVEGFNLD